MRILGVAGAAAILAALLAPATGRADPFPTHQGESGLIDVPDAEVIDRGTGLVGAEAGWDHEKGSPDRLGPMPASIGIGLGALEWGFSTRESGQPGDPHPASVLFGSALKLHLSSGAGLLPSVAVDGYTDRLNASGAGGGRAIVSFGRDGPLRVAGYGGWETEANGPRGATAGLAIAVGPQHGLHVVLDGTHGPRGDLLGGAIRWEATRRLGISLGASYLPDEHGVRIAIGFGFLAAPTRQLQAAAPVEEETVRPEPEEPTALALGDHPRFRLALHAYGPALLGVPRHVQYDSFQPGAAPSVTSPDEGGPLHAQETALDARLARLAARRDALDRAEEALDPEARRLDTLARQLDDRERATAAREEQLPRAGAASQRLRRLELQLDQLTAEERPLAARARGFATARDASLAAERAAATREQAARSDAERLTALAELEPLAPRRLDLLGLALVARTRMAAAAEARAAARADRLEVAARLQRATAALLGARGHRLDLRDERLALLGTAPPPAPAAAAPADHATAPVDHAVYVLVLRSPTVTAAAGATAGAAGPTRDAIHPGLPVGMGVAAATILSFDSPAAVISELDRESLDGIVRAAARDRCELFIWARAKTPGLLAEATRRSEEIKSYAIGLGGLSEQQVVTRITTRPGAQGVDVVVSALHEGGASSTAADAAPPAPTAGRLAPGEAGIRQVRDALRAVQPSIERCVGEQMARHGLAQGAGALHLAVGAAGRVTSVAAGGGELAGPEIDACLGQAAAGWRFPPADTDYAVDAPLTVVGAGAAR